MISVIKKYIPNLIFAEINTYEKMILKELSEIGNKSTWANILL